MSSFGELFPDSFKKDFGKRSIEPGTVLRFFASSTKPPKIKRLVVLSVSGDKVCVAYLFINSKINPNLFNTPSLRSLHYPLKSNSSEFLNKDSFLDCSFLHEIHHDALIQIISNDPSVHIGNLSTHDFESALSIVNTAPTIDRSMKEKYKLL